jgi:hypothetical protein
LHCNLNLGKNKHIQATDQCKVSGGSFKWRANICCLKGYGRGGYGQGFDPRGAVFGGDEDEEDFDEEGFEDGSYYDEEDMS